MYPYEHLDAYRNGIRYDEVYPKYELIGTHTGHCDYKSMKPYIDITESAKRDAVKKMEEAFN